MKKLVFILMILLVAAPAAAAPKVVYRDGWAVQNSPCYDRSSYCYQSIGEGIVTLNSNCVVSVKMYGNFYESIQYHAGYDTFVTIEPYSSSFHSELNSFLQEIFFKIPILGWCPNETFTVHLRQVGQTFQASPH